MLGINIEAMAKAEAAKVKDKLMKIDVNHNGISDVVEVEKLFEEAAADIRALEEKVTPAEMAFAINLLFPNKFGAEDILKAEGAVNKVLTGVERLKELAKAAGTTLG